MRKQTKISNAVIKRLPRYRRYLNELRKKGRQDLNNFGGFGQQGYGYSVEGLYNEISAILGLDKEYKLVVVGAGRLGQAIVNYTYYYKSGFVVKGIFEIDKNIIGKNINGVEVMDYDNIVEYVENEKIDIGVICTTRDAAQEVADKLSFAGVRGLWNFAPVDIETPAHVAVENVHISESLHSLVYHMNKNDEGTEKKSRKK